MTIRKKIILSNILMIFIPVVLIVIVVGIGIKMIGLGYLAGIEKMYERNDLISAQSLLYAGQEQLLQKYWEAYESELSIKAVVKGKLIGNDFEEELLEIGYHLNLIVDGKSIYSSLNELDDEVIQSIGGDLMNLKDMTASDGNRSIIKVTFIEDGVQYSIIGVNNGTMSNGVQEYSYFRKYLIMFALIFIIFVFLVIFITNAILSRWITSSILHPLDRLRIGTRNIKEGNLDYKIDYTKEDEFGQVCSDFDEMRIHLKRSVEEQLQYENYRKELVSGISHDLRTPLTSIKGYAEGLLDGIADTIEKQKIYYLAIMTRSKDMEYLLDSLSVYNRFESKSFHYNMEKLDLLTYIMKYFDDRQEELNKNNVEVSYCRKAYDIRGEKSENSFPILLDATEFQRVLDNLLSNSIRYRTEGASNIRISLSHDESHIYMKYADDGPGVPKEYLGSIFESFYRLDESRTRSGEGSGLGLAIVKEIINGHGGTIKAVTQGGLTLEIVLPLIVEKKG